MAEYQHGGDIYTASEILGINRDKLLDFSANINPYGMPPPVQEAIAMSAKWADCYPDYKCRRLVRKLAQAENIPENWVLCGNGAADLIFRLVLACGCKKALLSAPTFGEYEAALRAVKCQIFYYDLKEQNEFSINSDFFDYIQEVKPNVLFLCNPNNPTGLLTSATMMEQILQLCERIGCLLVADECFLDFVENGALHSMKPALHSHTNLVILKAFTKLYAMAGVRLGYCLCSNVDLLDQIERCGQPWSVSSIAQWAGEVALDQVEYVEKSLRKIAAERERLKQDLTALNFRVWNSKANYLFFRTGLPALSKRLLMKGILVRSCGNYRGLDDSYYRIAVKKPEENERLIEELRLICSGVEEGK